MEIVPSLPFTIWRKLEDPSDSTTYYVKAEVRDMRSNDLLLTVRLTDQGNQIFSKEIDAPGDSSGQGRWIAISTKVYTDSGYTTLSPIHREESREYKVIRRLTSLGGGGSAGVDYDKIFKLFGQSIEKLPKPEKISLATLEDLIREVGNKVDGIEMPTTDLSPLLEAIREVKNDLQNSIKSIPKPEPINLSPVMEKLSVLDRLDKVISAIEMIGKASENLSKLSNDIKEFLISHTDEIDKKLEKAFKEFTDKADAISNLTFSVQPSLSSGNGEQSETPSPHISRAKRLF